MATVKFDHRVKYARVWHPAHTVFDVEDKDVPELKKLGCQVLSYNEVVTHIAVVRLNWIGKLQQTVLRAQNENLIFRHNLLRIS